MSRCVAIKVMSPARHRSHEESMETKRVLLPDDHHDGEAIRTALRSLIDAVDGDDNIRRCILYVPTKGALQGTTLEKVLGSKAAKLLLKNNELSLGTATLRLETHQTFKTYSPGEAVIAVYADQAMMDATDANRNLRLVICVPHVTEAVTGWQRSWNLGIDGASEPDEPLLSNRIVEAALVSMTGRINLAQKILGPRDNEAVRDAFRILRAHNQSDDLECIRAWCIRHGWHAKAADEAVKHATKAFSLLRKPSPAGQHWADDIYARWNAAANRAP